MGLNTQERPFRLIRGRGLAAIGSSDGRSSGRGLLCGLLGCTCLGVRSNGGGAALGCVLGVTVVAELLRLPRVAAVGGGPLLGRALVEDRLLPVRATRR